MGPVNVDVEATFPADLETVFAMLSDPGYVSKKAEAMFAISHEVDVEPRDDGGVTISLERTLPAKVPDAVRRIVGDTITVRQVDAWGPPAANGSREATLDATIEKAPSTIHGSMHLTERSATETHLRVQAKINGNVPFIGKKIEKAAGEIIVKAARKEEQVGREWLAERG